MTIRTEKWCERSTMHTSSLFSQLYQESAVTSEFVTKIPIMSMKEEEIVQEEEQVAITSEEEVNTVESSKPISTEEVQEVQEVQEVTSSPSRRKRRFNVDREMDRIPSPTFDNPLSWDYMSSLYEYVEI